MQLIYNIIFLKFTFISKNITFYNLTTIEIYPPSLSNFFKEGDMNPSDIAAGMTGVLQLAGAGRLSGGRGGQLLQQLARRAATPATVDRADARLRASGRLQLSRSGRRLYPPPRRRRGPLRRVEGRG